MDRSGWKRAPGRLGIFDHAQARIIASMYGRPPVVLGGLSRQSTIVWWKRHGASERYGDIVT
jgi:hypothetical protein